MITEERAKVLADYLTSDTESAQRLLDLPAEEALKEINADGNDFTLEEMKAFGEQLQTVSVRSNGSGELDVESLDEVSGGLAAAAAAVYVACASLGVTLGIASGTRYKW